MHFKIMNLTQKIENFDYQWSKQYSKILFPASSTLTKIFYFVGQKSKYFATTNCAFQILKLCKVKMRHLLTKCIFKAIFSLCKRWNLQMAAFTFTVCYLSVSVEFTHRERTSSNIFVMLLYLKCFYFFAELERYFNKKNGIIMT